MHDRIEKYLRVNIDYKVERVLNICKDLNAIHIIIEILNIVSKRARAETTSLYRKFCKRHIAIFENIAMTEVNRVEQSEIATSMIGEVNIKYRLRLHEEERDQTNDATTQWVVHLQSLDALK